MSSTISTKLETYSQGAIDALRVAVAILEEGKELDRRAIDSIVVNLRRDCCEDWYQNRERNLEELIRKIKDQPKVGDVVRATRDNKWNFIVLITESQADELAGIILKDESNYEDIPTQLGRSTKGEHILLDSPNVIPYNVEVINHFAAFSRVMEDYDKALSDSVYAVMKEL